MRKFTLTIFILLMFTIIFTGCSYGPICGDGFCDSVERFMGDCPQDCNVVPEPECRVDSDCEDGDEGTYDYCVDNECIYEQNLLMAYLEVATLKNIYQTGEPIRLTDPPFNVESEEMIEPFEMRFSNEVRPASNIRGLMPGIYVNKETGQQVLVETYLPVSMDDATESSVLNVKQTSKYLVKLKGKPVLEEYADLSKEISKKQLELESVKVLSSISGNAILQQENEIQILQTQLTSKVIERSTLVKSEQLVAKVSLSRKVSGFDKKVEKEFTKTFNGMLVEMTETEAKTVKESSLVEEVYPDYEVKALLMDSASLIGANLAWNLNYTGEGITIAIVDTGIDYTHSDLGGCLGPDCKVIGGYDFINEDNDPMDDHGHGTHCAGTAAGNGVLTGIAPDAKLLGYKVLDAGGSGAFSTVLAGMEAAVDPNGDGDFNDRADVISMSLGGYGNPDDPLSLAADMIMDAGSIIVIAAGNSGPGSNSIGSPGTSRKAITVGATFKKNYEAIQLECTPGEETDCGLCDEEGFAYCSYWGSENPVTDEITSFSSRGPVIWDEGMIVKPDVLAPGALICAARYDSLFPYGEHMFYHPCYDEEHVQLAGTSMATPHIAGVAALMKQAHPEWTSQEIKQVIKNTAIDLGEDINSQGAGRVDVLAAIEASKPPTAMIETNGLVSGYEIDIVGTASANQFMNYQLSYYNNLIGMWVTICESNSEIIGDVLCTWNMDDVLSGEYLLKLVVNSELATSKEYSYINFRNQLITSPRDIYGFDAGYKLYRQDGEVLIEGVALDSNFDNYEFVLCKSGGRYCTSEGIELTNGGLEPVLGGVLGTLDLSTIFESEFYYLILQLFDSRGNMQSVTNKIYIETQSQDGWPKEIELQGTGGWALSFLDQPTIVDMNNDGFENLVITYGHHISVFNGNGEFMNNWPLEINTSCFRYYTNSTVDAIIQAGSAVGDIDGDGDLEIVIGDNCGYLHVLNHDATYLSGWPKLIYLTGWRSPSLADIDADGFLDIIVTNGASWKVIDRTGDYLPGWPIWLQSNPDFNGFYSSDYSAATANFDDDEEIELVLTTTGLNSSDWEANNIMTRIFLVDNDGDIMSGWPKEVYRGRSSEPTIADVDGDGEFEIVVSSYDGVLYAWNADGSLVNNWPIETGGAYSFDQPVIVDIDYDGVLEVMVTGYNSEWYTCLYAYNLNGEEKTGFPICEEYGTVYSNFGGSPSVGNLDLDPEQEFFASYGGGWSSYSIGGMMRIYGINHDGSIMDGFPKYLARGGRLGEVAPIVDLDKDGDNELIMYTWGGLVQVFDLGGLSGHDEWPEFYNGEEHTSTYQSMTAPSFKSKSQIVNEDERIFLSGYLYMALEKLDGDDFWQPHMTVVNDEEARTINPEESLPLDYLWNDFNAAVFEPGDYRVIAEFRNEEGFPIETSTGFLDGTWEFVVE